MKNEFEYKVGTLFLSDIDQKQIGILIQRYECKTYTMGKISGVDNMYLVMFPDNGFFLEKEEMNETEIGCYLKVLYEPSK